MLVEALVAHPALEALGEGVLRRLARGNVAPADPRGLGEAEDCRQGELRAVVKMTALIARRGRPEVIVSEERVPVLLKPVPSMR